MTNIPGGSSSPDYPRACGVTYSHFVLLDVDGGLSPRMRGHHLVQHGVDDLVRTIPAHAGSPAESLPCLLTTRDYPRACGVTSALDPLWPALQGLSPRMRGHLPKSLIIQCQKGTIPAHAGSPSPAPSSRSFSKDYPRACGVTFTLVAHLNLLQGLSPRMRGHHQVIGVVETHVGTIPAHAGSPPRNRRRRATGRDYPRACGVTSSALTSSTRGEGLSPRMRGHPTITVRPSMDARTIPAHAGSPALLAVTTFKWEDYPRACGVTELFDGERETIEGLSPRMRGHPPTGGDWPCAAWTIPAHAGSPSTSSVGRGAIRDYPRACGVTGVTTQRFQELRGLSPRMRGHPTRGIVAGGRAGTIPAHAGSPVNPRSSSAPTRDYPRACGVTPWWAARASKAGGLSPRMRGHRRQRKVARRRRWTIPAHAGSPRRTVPTGRGRRDYPRACGVTSRTMSASTASRGLSPRMRGHRPRGPDVRKRCGTIPAHAGSPTSTS